MFKKYIYKAVMLLAVFSLTISAMGMNTTSARAAGIIYVNTTASGANDGSSWGNAYLTLQDALAAAASGDQIWVAAGVYYPDAGVGQTNNSRSSTFTLINGVQIYGGFAGTEALLSERNISANVTILSGDLEQNDTNADADFTAETTADIIGNNAYHVVRGGDATATTILDGFTITAGNADGVSFDNQNGGGMFNWNANPTLQNLIFSGNKASEVNGGVGGGVYNYIINTPIQFTNVTFTGNHAYAGGGMAGDPDIIVTNSTFINNTAANTGGGIDITQGDAVLTNVIFTNNSAVGGGGMNILLGNPTLTNVTFSDNTADSAGAVNVSQGNPEFINVTFENNTATDDYGGAVQLSQSAAIFRNVTFNNNSADNNGGGLFSSTFSDPTLANVTFTNNSAVNSGGGMYTGGSSDATLTNVTFSNNTATNGGGLLALNGTVTLQNTIIANNTGGDCITSSAVFNGAGHNLIESTGADACNLSNGVNGNIIGSDPALGTLTGSPAYFPLNTGSPAIDAGDNTVCAAAPVNNQSQNGVTRPQGSYCDIGSYELLIPSPTSLVNSVLPTSRTPVVGSPVTIFNTVVNAGSETASGVTLSMNPAPAGTFSYNQTNCATNAVIGAPNAPVDIAPGGVACYVLSFTPSAAFSATQVHIQAQASNASGTTLLPGINTWLLRATVSQGPDIIALTTTTDFHQVACSGLNAFAVALSNVGTAASGDITVSANTGSASLPISVSIQETNPGTGTIIGDNILNNLGAGENRTVAVFVTFNGCVSFDPAANRIFIEFRDASNNVLGSTSTAVSTNR